MGNCVTDWVFRRQRFCCCLPARLGAGLLAFLTLLVSGLLMIILWYEVATNWYLSSKEKTAYILAGILETCLFIASILGFIGVCARKQCFVVIFATFLYVHFFINLGVAAYFLWMVTHVANKDIVKLCEEGIRNEQGQDQCKGLLNITKGVYWGISLLVLAIEAYCTLVVTRYVNQIRYEKRDVRKSRMMQRQSAYDAFHARFSSVSMNDVQHEDKRYSSLSGTTAHNHDDEDLESGGDKEALLNAPKATFFDPYAAYDPHPSTSPAVSPSPSMVGFDVSSARRSMERHRGEAERQLTGGGVHSSEETEEERGRGRGRSIDAAVQSLALPPGAAPAIPPTIPRSREGSVTPVPSSSPPPAYGK